MRAPRGLPRWLIAATAAFLALALWVRLSPATELLPNGDVALIEGYTLHATHAQAFLGPYSRWSWNHPGPLYFYLLAPLYAASGYRTTALFAGAAALNAIALVTAVWMAAVAARRTFAVALGAAAVLFTVRAAESVASAWNPHVLPLGTVAFVVLAAAAMAGRARLLPALAVVGTFLMQTHLGTVPVVVSVAAVAIVGGWLGSDDRRRFIRSLAVAAAVFVALWMPPLLEEFRHAPGNMTLIWRFFASEPAAPHALAAAVAMWADLLTGLVRPGFVVPWGNAMPPDRTGLAVAIAWAQIGLVALGTWQAARERHVFQRSLGVLLLVAAAVSLVSVARLSGELVHYPVYWIAALGLLNMAYAADLLADALGLRLEQRPRAAIAAGAVLCVAALLPIWRETAAVLRHPERRLGDGLIAQRLADEVSAYVRTHPEMGKPLVRMGGDPWFIGAAIVLRLQKTRVPCAVERSREYMFSDLTAPDGTEQWTLTVADRDDREVILGAGGQTEIAEHRGFSIFVDPSPPPYEPRRR